MNRLTFVQTLNEFTHVLTSFPLCHTYEGTCANVTKSLTPSQDMTLFFIGILFLDSDFPVWHGSGHPMAQSKSDLSARCKNYFGPKKNSDPRKEELVREREKPFRRKKEFWN